jgi:NADH-quinone oxidoreductase subunit L
MARALRILWRGSGNHSDAPESRAALNWMGTGLAGLVILAVILAAFFPAIETMLPARLPENSLAQVLGLSAALAGLSLGWLVPVRRLFGPLLPWIQQGFVIAGGVDNLLVRPAFAIAHLCNKLESRLYAMTLLTGRMTISIGRSVRFSDEQGIDGLIFSIVKGTLNLGSHARNLQNGLIHRELAITVVLTTVLLSATLIMLFI